MEPLDRNAAKILFNHYRKNREGIRNKPEMASIWMICGSIHIIPKADDEHKLVCRNCGLRLCTCGCSCGSCACPPG